MELGVPISMDKTEWAEEIIIFLGILLDGRNFCLGIPVEKQEKALNLLLTMRDKKKSTVKDLQVLCGYLNFLGKAIFPGRAFTRHMYAKYSHLVNITSLKNEASDKINYKLKQHHHLALDQEFKADCDVWINVLQGDLSKVVSRPMVNLIGNSVITSNQIEFYSDASAAKKLGFGSILNKKWIQGFWPEHFIEDERPSIEFLELFTLAAGILTWQDEPGLINCRIMVHCDNTTVVQMINDTTSSCEHCMYLIRLLVLNGLKLNRSLSAQYISSQDNFLSDSLSRGQWQRFRTLGPEMNVAPDTIAEEIWPIYKVWNAKWVTVPRN